MLNIEVIAPTMEIQAPSDTVVHTELKILAEPNLAMPVSSRLCRPAGYGYGGNNREHGQTYRRRSLWYRIKKKKKWANNSLLWPLLYTVYLPSTTFKMLILLL